MSLLSLCCAFCLVSVVVLVLTDAGWCQSPRSDDQGSPYGRLRVAAFNIEVFGRKKMGNTGVAIIIKKIMERYDVVAIQEIRDKSGRAVHKLSRMLGPNFAYVINERLGTTKSKEQYAFFYRSDRVVLQGRYQYPDTGKVFEREPFAVRVAPKFAENKAVTLIVLHSRPRDAVAELGHLEEVISETLAKLGHDSELFVLGDLNAGCRFAKYRKRRRAKNPLTVNTEAYTWLIGENADTTTTTTTNCPYDRIIVKTRPSGTYVVPNSAKVFDFAQWFGLSETEAEEVSDHYPVEVQLQFN